ncbi:hypothetical protein [Lyngbya sp. PCC 8106]|uniref:hypothetical protein n=1 Tax=Lyngbya sp. (strain PCC 8106) TaxID=313612 RepID=UPI0000EA9F1B|nr:hypothetical protein [Lyngbya sp. PCC 8106]EAW38954.1 hypothetical protein L8106_01527 [Lyngbya sp. PCC 8106]
MVKTDNETVDKFAQLIENLPSDSFLSIDLTEDQKQYWHQMRKSSIFVAKAFRTQFSPKESLEASRFEQFCEQQGLDPIKQKSLIAVAKHYKILWEVVQLGEDYVMVFHFLLPCILELWSQDKSNKKAVLLQRFIWEISQKEYTFNSPEDLFCEILIEDTDLLFKDCLKPYYDVSIYESKKIINILKKLFINYNPLNKTPFNFEDPPKNSEQNLKDFTHYIKNQQMTYSWKELTIFSCCILMIFEPNWRNRNLIKKLIEYGKSVIELSSISFTAFRKRESPTWKKLHSYQWMNGERLYGCEKGGTYCKP